MSSLIESPATLSNKSEWERKPVGDLLLPQTTINPLLFPERLFSYIDVSSVSTKTCAIEEPQTLLGKDAPSRARKVVLKNDVIFATIRPTLKRAALIPEEFDNQICSTGYVVLRPKPELNSRYLFYWLFTKDFSEKMAALQRGASYPAISDADVRRQPISLPSWSEQARIVAILDGAFEGVESAKANLGKRNELARCLFDKYLHLAVTHRHLGWREMPLAAISREFGRGKSKHRPRNDPKLYEGPYPFVQTGDISNSDHWLTSYKQTYSEVGLAQSRLWPKGTVCIAIVGATVGETAILDFEACFPDSVIGIVVDEQIADNEYVEYLLQASKSVLKEKGKGTARDNINLGTFENHKFLFPPLNQQREIVANIKALSEELGFLSSVGQKKIVAIEELKQSLLDQAFSGNL